MTWENRQGRGHYFTHTMRIGKRFIRLYFGKGTVAEFASLTLESDRRNRAKSRQERLVWWRELRAIDRHATHLQMHLRRFKDVTGPSTPSEEGRSSNG